MTTVHCPTCNRALRLPDTLEAATAQCPLCGTTFPVAAEPPLVAEPVRPEVPVERIVPLPAEPVEPSPRRPRPRTGELNSPEDRAAREDRRAVVKAATWMKAAGWLGTFQVLTCGLCQGLVLVAVMDRGPGAGVGYVFITLTVLRFVALQLVLEGARCLLRQTQPTRVRMAGGVAFLMGLLVLAERIVFLAQSSTPAREDPLAVAFKLLGSLLDLAVVVCCWTGGYQAVDALDRPGVQKAFRR
ncbi:MAG: hypothetical protein U0736_12510 [Gemmataceae bacterium]